MSSEIPPNRESEDPAPFEQEAPTDRLLTVTERPLSQLYEVYDQLRAGLSEAEEGLLMNISSGINYRALDGPGWIHVATADRVVVGMTVCQPGETADSIELKVRYIRKANRGRGLGRQLLAAAWAKAQAEGFHHIHSNVTSPGAKKTMAELAEQFPGQVSYTDHGDWYRHLGGLSLFLGLWRSCMSEMNDDNPEALDGLPEREQTRLPITGSKVFTTFEGSLRSQYRLLEQDENSFRFQLQMDFGPEDSRLPHVMESTYRRITFPEMAGPFFLQDSKTDMNSCLPHGDACYVATWDVILLSGFPEDRRWTPLTKGRYSILAHELGHRIAKQTRRESPDMTTAEKEILAWEIAKETFGENPLFDHQDAHAQIDSYQDYERA